MYLVSERSLSNWTCSKISRPRRSAPSSSGRPPFRVSRSPGDSQSASQPAALALVRTTFAEPVRSGSTSSRRLDSTWTETVRNGQKRDLRAHADRTRTSTFWRVVGLYVAEGHVATDGRRPPDPVVFPSLGRERSRGRGQQRFGPATTSRSLCGSCPRRRPCRSPRACWPSGGSRSSVSARTATSNGCRTLSGRAPVEHKRALLAGLWRGDGSWSFVAGGPSVVLEYGTVSRELADGILRLLGEFGILARLKVGRTAKSTVDTYWLVVSGADQVEQLLDFVPPPDVAGDSLLDRTSTKADRADGIPSRRGTRPGSG